LIDLENGFRIALDIRRQRDVALDLGADLRGVVLQSLLAGGRSLLGLGC